MNVCWEQKAIRSFLLASVMLSLSCASIIGLKPLMTLKLSPSTQQESEITVRVIEDQGLGVIGAIVHLLDDSTMSFKAEVTNIDGIARMNAVPPGKKYAFVVSAPGYQPFISERFELPGGQNLQATVRVIIDR
jgi:hypothetical protein